MIITANDIRNIRPVAQNINDAQRIEPYIQEVENAIVVPQFGAKCYKFILDDADNARRAKESDSAPLTAADLSAPNYQRVAVLMYGGFYADDTAYFAGLISSVAYLAYARMVRNQSANVTAFGVVFKNGELSERADDATIARLANEAEKIGMQQLHECVAYLQWLGMIPTSVQPVHKRKFVAFDNRTNLAPRKQTPDFTYQSTIEELKREIAEKTAEIASLNREIADLQDQIAHHEEIVAYLNARIDALQAEITDLNSQIAVLTAKNEELAQTITTEREIAANGKKTIADTITSLGVPTEPTADYSQLADNITQIFDTIDMGAPISLSYNGSYKVITANLSFFDLSAFTNITNMFNSCAQLRKVIFPELPMVQTMQQTFNGSKLLEEVIFPKKLPALQNGDRMFYGCSSLTHVEMPTELPALQNGSYMFYGCSSLTHVEMPKKLPALQNSSYMFHSCSSLTHVEMPDLPKITNIDRLFQSCYALRSLSFGDMPLITTANAYTFYECNSLTDLRVKPNTFRINGAQMQWSPLTRESAINLFNGLHDFIAEGDTTPREIQISTYTKQIIRPEDIAIATAKGWTVA